MSDLISRKALLETINEHEQGWRKHSEQGELTSYAVGLGLRIAMEAIYEQPTVDAAPVVHGEWKPTGNMEEWYCEEHICSMCSGIMIGTAAFCPDCGAKMDEEGDSSE